MDNIDDVPSLMVILVFDVDSSEEWKISEVRIETPEKPDR